VATAGGLASAFKASEGGSTRVLWVRLVLIALILGVITELIICGLQLRQVVLGRVPIGWPLTGAYYITLTSDSITSLINSTQSHFDIQWGPLLADLAIVSGAYLVAFLALRVASVMMKPKLRTLEDL
jgi:hypothetical protein